ncbi:hypothetical protein LINGRAHAP2_LOCUS36340 [Linum grandiflorum]
MKTSNIFLLFIVIFFVIAGNEVATAGRIDNGCRLGSFKGHDLCVPKECTDQCVSKFGNPGPFGSPTIGYCEGSICDCISDPC